MGKVLPFELSRSEEKKKLTPFGFQIALNTYLDGVPGGYLFQQVIPQLEVDSEGNILPDALGKMRFALGELARIAPSEDVSRKYRQMLDFLADY